MRRAVLFGFLTLVIVMSGLTLLAYIQISKANDNIAQVIESNNIKTALYYEMRNTARERIISLHRMLETSDAFKRDEEWIKHSALAGKFIGAWQRLRELPRTREENLLFEKLLHTLQITQPVQTRLVNQLMAGNEVRARAMMETAAEAQEASLLYIERLVKAQQQRSKQNLQEAHSAYQSTVQYLVLISITILVFGGIIALLIRNSVAKSANTLLAINRELEATNYDLEDAQQASEAANVAKSDFLANMSHEIRTPMNVILSVIGILRSGKAGDLSTQANHMIEMAYRNSRHLLTLIDDLLSLSSIDNSKFKFKTERTNIRSELDNVVESLSHAAKQKGLLLSGHIDSELPKEIMVDPARLYQVLVNLVNNAIKYTEEGSIHITVRLIGSDDQQHIRFEIIDTGIGIPEEKQLEIFEQFVQVDASSTREYGGTGLGLAICKRLVEGMSGSIGMNSVEGRGSKFWFDLPYEAVESTNQASVA